MDKSQYYVVTELLTLFAIFVDGYCCLGAPLLNHTFRGKLSLFVVGGEVAYPHQFPYTVSIQQLRPQPHFPLWYHFCGGTIIAPRYVLTAAHCFANKHLEHGFLSTYRVVAGSTDLSKDLPGQQIKNLERAYLATNDIPSNNLCLIAPTDIGLLRLTTPWLWSVHVQPMDLPRTEISLEPTDLRIYPDLSKSEKPPRPRDPLRSLREQLRQSRKLSGSTKLSDSPERHESTNALMSGFGAIKDIKNVGSVKSSLLRYMDVPIISFNECVGKLKNQTTNYNNSLDPNDNFCTGTFTSTQEACIGDSGGPLVTMTDDGPVVIGVVSFGMRPCGYFKNAPTVYTKVSRFVPWIKQKMWYDEASWTDYMIVAVTEAITSLTNWIRNSIKCLRNGFCF